MSVHAGAKSVAEEEGLEEAREVGVLKRLGTGSGLIP